MSNDVDCIEAAFRMAREVSVDFSVSAQTPKSVIYFAREGDLLSISILPKGNKTVSPHAKGIVQPRAAAQKAAEESASQSGVSPNKVEGTTTGRNSRDNGTAQLLYRLVNWDEKFNASNEYWHSPKHQWFSLSSLSQADKESLRTNWDFYPIRRRLITPEDLA